MHGIQAGTIADACRRHGLAVAIRLATDRVVLGGLADALDRAQAELTTEGARCTRLAINVASHTPWMASATTALAQRVAAMPFSVPRAALVCNFSGAAARSPGDLKRALAGQIASTVLWDTCLDSIAERRVHCVLEVGPGSTLSKLWSERHPDVPARSIDEFRSPDAVVRWVTDTLAGG